ncbi:MAG TPA: hypothetical protein VGM68_09790, partial [Rhizomicrobium sp.]
AAGRGRDAGLIAVAGMVLGNGLITLPLSRLAYRWAKARNARAFAMLAFWCTLASVGNLIDYVPIRTFTMESDMGSVRKAFDWSPWTIMIVLGIPTLIILGDFLLRIVPATMAWLFPGNPARRIGIAVLAMAALFGFYGMVGFLEGGPVARLLSQLSLFAVIPAASLLQIALLKRR